MNLILKTNFAPATIDVNYEEIRTQLESGLQLYKNMVIDATQEDQVKGLKESLADLRKKRKELDDFRKSTKKEMSTGAVDFDTKMKELVKIIDDTIEPLGEILTTVQNAKKLKKKKDIEGMIEKVIVKYELNEKYAKELVVHDEWLKRSPSLKQVGVTIDDYAKELLKKQNTDGQDRVNVEEMCMRMSSAFGVTLLIDTYIAMLGKVKTSDILMQISEDAMRLKNQVSAQPKSKEELTSKGTDKPALPVVNVGDNKNALYDETYNVKATEQRLQELEEYMDSKQIKYVIVEEV